MFQYTASDLSLVAILGVDFPHVLCSPFSVMSVILLTVLMTFVTVPI